MSDEDWRKAPCRKCRTKVMLWWRFCPACGQQLPSVMDPCKHDNADHLGPDVERFGIAGLHPVEHFVCTDCGEWLSLGPANDDGEHAQTVDIEKRAAAIVLSGYRLNGGTLRSLHWYEGCGWNAANPDPDVIGHQACDNGEPEDGPMHQAGYLASIIHNHQWTFEDS
jgi:hypothetical protein